MGYHRWTTFALTGAIALACFAQAPAKKGKAAVTKKDFGKTAGGQAVELYTLTNANGSQPYTATVTVSAFARSGSHFGQSLR